MSGATVLAALEAHFETHYVLEGKPYLKAAQVVHRLNETLGLAAWTHTVIRDGYDEKSDTVWCYGQMRGVIDAVEFVREAYGGQKIKRSRSTGEPVNYGDDLKAAQTDSLKKCAKQIGVGSYLDDPDEVALATREQAERRRTGAANVAAGANGQAANTVTGEVLACDDCGKPIEIARFADNTTWSIQKLVTESRRIFSKTLCIADYSKRKRDKATEAASKIPALRRGVPPPEFGG